MKTDKIIAYEWHNHETGHCYVDYVPHPEQDEKDGYTKTALCAAQQSKIPTREEAEAQALKYEPVYRERLYMEGFMHGFIASFEWLRNQITG